MNFSLEELLSGIEGRLKHDFARRLQEISHRFDENDLYQVTAIRAVTHAESCNAETMSSAEYWVYSIANNVFASAWREHRLSQKRTTRFETGSVNDYDEHIGEHDDLSPDLMAEAEEESQRLTQHMDRLPVRQREALRLRVFEQESYQTIGLRLDCSPKAARNLVSRAIAQLRVEYTQAGLRFE